VGKDLLPEEIRAAYQVEERHHACSILKTDFPDQWKDLFIELGKLTAAGMSTTHMSKVIPTFC